MASAAAGGGVGVGVVERKADADDGNGSDDCLMDVDDFGEDTFCGKCRKDELEELVHDPNFALKVAPCGHKLCGDCEHRLLKGKLTAVPCPRTGCNKFIAKAALSFKSLEQQEFEREIAIRKDLSSIFTKTEIDFATMDEYNDYLERVDQYVFNLVMKEDVEATQAAISAYKAANRDTIKAQVHQREAADRKIGEKLERERREKLAMIRDQDAEDMRGKKARMAKHLDSIAVVVGEKEPPPPPEPTTASAVSKIPLAHIPLPRWTRVPHQRPDSDLPIKDKFLRRTAGGFCRKASRGREKREALLTLFIIK